MPRSLARRWLAVAASCLVAAGLFTVSEVNPPAAQASLSSVPLDQVALGKMLVDYKTAGLLTTYCTVDPNSAVLCADGADAIYKDEIEPLSRGVVPAQGAACSIDPRILQLLVLVIDHFQQRVNVTDIERYCINSQLSKFQHGAQNGHGGWAIDIDSIGGVAVNGSSQKDADLLAYLRSIRPTTGTLHVGQTLCANHVNYAEFSNFDDSCTHQHIDFNSTPVGLNFPTAPVNVQPIGNYESVSSSSPNSIVASGWAYDPDTQATPSAVALYLDNVRVAYTAASLSRPDVAAQHPAAGPNHGFAYEIIASPGTHTLGVTALDSTTGQEFGLTTKTVVVSGIQPTSRRIQGSDRYATASAISTEEYPSGAPVVYIASGQNSVDAMSASSAAAKAGGPLLLNDGSNLQAATQSELLRLAPSRVFFVGGAATMPDAVLSATRAILPNATITRLDGADRFEASRNVIRSAGFVNPPVLFVVDSNAWTDGLPAGNTASFNGEPLLVVNGPSGTIDSATTALIQELNPGAIRVIGGPAGVSENTLQALAAIVPGTARVSGDDRFTTAVVVAGRTYTGAKPTAYIVSGINYADGMSASILSGSKASPLFLSRPECVDQSTMRAIYKTFAAQQVVLIGGTATLSADVAALKPCGV